MLNVKMFYRNCLQMKENRLLNERTRRALQTDVGLCISIQALVFMALPTMDYDGPREDSVEFMPVLFVAITNHRCISCAKKELRKKWLDWTLALLMSNPTLPPLRPPLLRSGRRELLSSGRWGRGGFSF